jgi:hypothetical protein
MAVPTILRELRETADKLHTLSRFFAAESIHRSQLQLMSMQLHALAANLEKKDWISGL